MSLTEVKLLRLQDAGLLALYEKHAGLWHKKAEEAFSYTKEILKDRTKTVRQDDVLPLLRPSLELCAELRDFLAEKKLRPLHWYTFFAELILDRLWPDLSKS